MIKKFFLSALMLIFTLVGKAQTVAVCSDQWAATDALGRTLGRYDGVKRDKQVFIFYWTWHERYDAPGTEVKDNTEIIRRFPEAMQDAYHPAWTEKATGNYYWGEPLSATITPRIPGCCASTPNYWPTQR